jgi:hypothetical protein
MLVDRFCNVKNVRIDTKESIYETCVMIGTTNNEEVDPST